MSVDILHAGFDGLKVTVEAFVSSNVREILFAAKEEATATMRDASTNVNGFDIAVRRSGGKNISAHTGEYGAELRILDPDAHKGFEPGVERGDPVLRLTANRAQNHIHHQRNRKPEQGDRENHKNTRQLSNR